MIDEDEVRKSLLAKREQLAQRVGRTQATERQEVAEGQNDNAQLWEVSDVRDDLDAQGLAGVVVEPGNPRIVFVTAHDPENASSDFGRIKIYRRLRL